MSDVNTVEHPDAPTPHDVDLAANTALGGRPGMFARVPAQRLGAGRREGLLVPAWQPVAAIGSLLVAVTVSLGVLQKSYCFANGWGGTSVFWRACYSDLPNMYVSSGLGEGRFPYEMYNALTQPVGTGFFLWLLALVTPRGDADARIFVAVWAVAAALLAIGLVVVTAATSRTRPRAAIMLAVSPLLITLPLVSADLLGVFLVSAALLLWARERPAAAGAVFAAAILSRSYALIVLAAIGLTAVRAGRVGAFARTASVAIGAAVLVLLALRLVQLDVFSSYIAWAGGSAEFGSLQYALTLAGVTLSPLVSSVVAVTGWVIALIAGAVVALSVRHRPRIAEVAVVMVVIVLLTAKSVPPQWALWLLPLVVLARVPWGLFLTWSAIEVVYFVMVWMHIPIGTEPLRALPTGWYAFFLLLRLGGLVALAWWSWRQAALRPRARLLDEHEAAASEPDDLAGPAAGARDSLVVTF